MKIMLYGLECYGSESSVLDQHREVTRRLGDLVGADYIEYHNDGDVGETYVIVRGSESFEIGARGGKPDGAFLTIKQT